MSDRAVSQNESQRQRKEQNIQSGPVAAVAHLEAVWMCNLVADGALHQHEVELVLLVIHRVLLAGLSADDAHGRVGQDGLEGKEGNTIRTAGVGSDRTDFRQSSAAETQSTAECVCVSVRGAEALSMRHGRSLCGRF